MVQYCRVEMKIVSVESDFGEKIAREKFGDAHYAALPEYTRGPRKGAKKGFVHWDKCTVGGWSRDRNCVVYPGSHNWRLSTSQDPRNATKVIARGEYQTGKFVVSDPASERLAYIERQRDNLTRDVLDHARDAANMHLAAVASIEAGEFATAKMAQEYAAGWYGLAVTGRANLLRLDQIPA